MTNLQLDTGAKVSYPVLNVKVFLENGEVKIFRALNEASIRRSDRTMVADVVINGVHFERFRGDGLTVSTPLVVQPITNHLAELFYTLPLKLFSLTGNCQP